MATTAKQYLQGAAITAGLMFSGFAISEARASTPVIINDDFIAASDIGIFFALAAVVLIVCEIAIRRSNAK